MSAEGLPRPVQVAFVTDSGAPRRRTMAWVAPSSRTRGMTTVGRIISPSSGAVQVHAQVEAVVEAPSVLGAEGAAGTVSPHPHKAHGGALCALRHHQVTCHRHVLVGATPPVNTTMIDKQTCPTGRGSAARRKEGPGPAAARRAPLLLGVPRRRIIGGTHHPPPPPPPPHRTAQAVVSPSLLL